MAKFALSGSDRSPLPGAKSSGKADPNERLEVTVLLRRRNADALRAHVGKAVGADPAAQVMTREDFEASHGAYPADVEVLKTFASGHGLVVTQTNLGRRTVVLAGTVSQFNAAFEVDLQNFEHPDGSYRGRTGAVHLPQELQGIVEAVLGLDNRPQAQTHFRVQPDGGEHVTRGPAAKTSSFTPVQLASLYNFPAGNGAGQCIAIIELGGGYRTADLSAYFAQLGVKAPAVTAVSVDHAGNRPTGSANGPDGEVMLDIEVAGALAPGARLAVYFAPNTDAGFLDAITSAVHDAVNKPSVISISWGGPESTWTPQSLTAYDQAFQAAAAMGVTVCAASGDNGSGDGVNDGKDHVDFPASSPHVLACGGTNLRANGNTIVGETVWNNGSQAGAGGGGVSNFFARPVWQEGLKVSKNGGASSALANRGVPDVSGDADPQTGYVVRVDGKSMVIGGTSAVAPLWAGLVARMNAIKGRNLGFIHTKLYANPATLKDISQGNNGSYAATAGWDACTGLGSPDGVKLAALF